SGAWEKDFSRSDSWDKELNRQLEQMRRDAQRGRSDPGLRTLPPPGSVRGGASIVDLAQLAGYVNRQTIMRIYQTTDEIKIEKEGDADLICSTVGDASTPFVSEFGGEVCGWDGLQLVFRIRLPEGVEILHRFSVSDDREWLNMATSVSNGGADPFTLIQFFRRYEAPGENFSCITTITRGNSCSLLEAQQNGRD
ncbi:MAG: hypothetical protein WD772_12180, partial [Pseudohongiellaceae bacterium]